MPTAGGDNSNLPGMGGVYNSVNFALYHFASNNPVRYVDPDGRLSGIPFDVQKHLDQHNTNLATEAVNKTLGSFFDSPFGKGIIIGGPGAVIVGFTLSIQGDTVDHTARSESNNSSNSEQTTPQAGGGNNGALKPPSGGIGGTTFPDDDPSDKWHPGSFNNSKESLKFHFDKHGKEVGASTPRQYLNKAQAFAQNLKGASKKPVTGETEGVIRYSKNGRYADIAPDNRIVSFGATE